MTAPKPAPDLATAPARAYRERIVSLACQHLRGQPVARRALDFGAGDGYVATRLEREGVAREIVCIDVTRRERTFRDVTLYDGVRLPFEDRSFDLAYAIDVLHHCPDPTAGLRELCRVSRRHVLLKDHTYVTPLGWATLCALDELGNRRFGIPSVYRYQRRWAWDAVLEAEGFTLADRVHPATCEDRPWGRFTNALQFTALWTRRA